MATPVASSSGTASQESRYYTLKGRRVEHIDSLDLSPEVEHYADILADLAEALGVDDLSFTSYSTAIDSLDAEEVLLARSLLRIRHAETVLAGCLSSIVHEERRIEEWTRLLQDTPDGHESMPALERRKAALNAKIKEYQKELDELKSDMPEEPPLTITDLASFRKQLKKQEQLLKEKRAKVEAFQGLPPNIELARHALQQARDEQMGLIQLREKLLGKMVDSVN